MPRRLSAVVMLLVVAVGLVAGCGPRATTSGTASTSASKVITFNPCTQIPADVIKQLADPATVDPDAGLSHRPAWGVCEWRSSWYFLTVRVTSHTLEETKDNPLFHCWNEFRGLGS